MEGAETPECGVDEPRAGRRGFGVDTVVRRSSQPQESTQGTDISSSSLSWLQGGKILMGKLRAGGS